MNAFESLVEMLLKREGYWTRTCFKVNLTAEEKRAIDRFSSPRWELDVVAFKGATNEILAVECKSFLDSRGVMFRNGEFEPAKRYKLFSDENLREVVLARLKKQLVECGAVPAAPTVTLCLAAGKIASGTDRTSLVKHMASNGWRLFDEKWVKQELQQAADAGYENDVAHVVAKLLLRNSRVLTGDNG
jgi:hypothetical protein